jgi:hypothetical protein
MVYQQLNKLEALQIGYLLKQNAHDPAIHVRWTLNLHSTSGTQVAPRLELEWCEVTRGVHRIMIQTR